MLVNVFNGGLNTRIAPQMLNLQEGVVYTNIDETRGTLISNKDKLPTGINTEPYAYYYTRESRWVSFPLFTSFVPYNESLVFCNSGGSGRIINGVSYPLGLANPSTIGPVAAVPVPPTPVSVAVLKTSTAVVTALPLQMYEYLVINASSDGRSEGLRIQVSDAGVVTVVSNNVSTAVAPSYITTPASGFMTLTFSAPATDVANIGFEVYRLYQGKYRLVGVLPSALSTFIDGTFAIPSSARTLVEADFAKLKGTYQYLLTFYNSVTGVESGASPVSPEIVLTNGGGASFTGLPLSAQANKKRLYRVGGALSAFALVATLDNAVTTYVDRVADNFIDGRILSTEDYQPAPVGMTFVEQSAGMLFGAVGNTLRFTPVAKPDAWPLAFSVAFDDAITGLAEVANGLLVFTRLKTYLMTGTGPSTLARQLVDSNQGCVAPESIQKLASAALWLSTDGICTSNGGPAQVISRDKLGKLAVTAVSSTLFDDTYYLALANGTTLVLSLAYGPVFKTLKLGVTSLATGYDKVYGWFEGQLYELFSSAEDLEFEYLSPRFIEGRATEAKTYKKLYFFAKGDIMVDVIIDDVTIVTGKKLDSGKATQVQPPQEEQRGHFIQFRIYGKGELLEYEYTAERRDD
jgi:hypothetical protein